MVKAIVLHSIVPVRTRAEEIAEQETQLLFAETCSLLEQTSKWVRIHNDADGSEGWVDRKMVTLLNGKEWKAIQETNRQARVCMPLAYAVSENNGQTVPLTAGTILPNYGKGEFEILGVRFRIDPTMVAEQPIKMDAIALQQTIRFFLNTPYLWGGKNALGMDCSGFTQVLYSLFGYALPRNAREQAKKGTSVKGLQQAQAGDLAFFDHEDGKISHVGILLDGERIVHCSGRVKIERIDEYGILSLENGNQYTHHLAAIRRYK